MQNSKPKKPLLSSSKLTVIGLLSYCAIIGSLELRRFEKNQRDKETKIALDIVERDQISLSRDIKNAEDELKRLEKLGNVTNADLNRMRMLSKQREIRLNQLKARLEQIDFKLAQVREKK